MNRLTEKVKTTDDYIKLPTKDKQEFINKLGKLEDFAEKIGCPLEVVSEISEHGFYNKYYCYIPAYRICQIDIFRKEIVYYDEDKNGFSVKLSDYKKEFWLREDRSE